MKDAKRFMTFVKPYRGLIITAILIGIIKFLFPVLSPVILKHVIDGVLFNQNLQDTEKIQHLLVTLAIVFFFYVILRPFVEYYRQYFAHSVSNQILRDVRLVIYKHLQKLSLRFYNNSKTGDIIAKVITDVEQTKNFVSVGFINIWIDVITVLIVIGIMLKFHVILTVVSLIIFPLYMFAVKYFYKRLKDATKQRSKSLGNLQSYLHEKIQGISVIMSFAREKEEFEKFTKKNDEFFQTSTLHNKRNAQTFTATNTIAEVAPLMVIMLAGIFVIKYDLTIGTLVAFVGLLPNLYTPLKRLADSANILTQSIASIERMYELLDEPYDIQDETDAKNITISKGDITFKNVSFGYNDENHVLKNINLIIHSGETVAFVGESGGGKSTLINLLPRFYDVLEGDIAIDGTSIKHYSLHSLRSQIGVVSQDNILFNESILENIRMGKPDATKEEIMESAIQAQAHDFIVDSPEGYDTEIGERGIKLSGGQKQRIALTRAFLKNPPILILDEATSALDLESEHLIQESLKVLSKGRTTLVIAHRLSTIVDADKIVYMENGKIQEVGTHEELMQKQGKYYDLFNLQKFN